MKTTLAILLLGIGFSGALQAKASQTFLWKGKGTLYSKDRKVVDEYDLTVENKDLPSGVTISQARITPKKGDTLTKTCAIKKSGEGWSIDCDDGNGGMYCFAHGTCTMYVSGENNVAFATTMVFDGESKMRIFIVSFGEHMIIRAIIVDDESYARQRLKKLLSRYGDIKVVAEAQNGVEALEKVDEIIPDIVFLDIEMPELSGIEVARSLGLGGPRIIFVTAYDEYALEAFESNSLDYSVKPVSSERLDICIRKIQNSIGLDSKSKSDAPYLENMRPSHKLAFKTGKQFKVIDVREISSIAAQDHYALIRLSEKEYFVDDTLTELEAKLPPGKFLRVHRSAIINLDCVSELSHKGDRKYTAILNDFSHSEIPISRSALPKLKRLLNL